MRVRGVQIEDGALRLEGEDRVLGLRGHGEFGIHVILDEEGGAGAGPLHVLVPARGAGRDAGGVGVVRRDVQDAGLRALQLRGGDPVRAHFQEVADRAVGRVDFADLRVGGILQAVDAVPPQHLHQHAVEIFRTGADEDLLGAHADAAAAPEIGGDGQAELRESEGGGADQDLLSVDREGPAHDPG